MSDDNDLICDFLGLVRAQHPEFTDEKLKAVERQIRYDWGGERVLQPSGDYMEGV